MTNATHVAIAGANGRMGRELLHACLENSHIELTAALVRAQSSYLGVTAAKLASLETESILCTSQDENLDQLTDVLIDFTLPVNTLNNIHTCIDSATAMVIGTTGFTTEQQSVIIRATNHIPILQASNMSIGVNLTLALLSQAAKVLSDNQSLKIEITETHHVHKLDAPSGTAITMGKVITNYLGTSSSSIDELIKFNSIREGEVVGDHTVSFVMDDELIEITHKAANRQIFAKGAIKAAQWLAGKKPGLYSMQDVLGL